MTPMDTNQSSSLLFVKNLRSPTSVQAWIRSNRSVRTNMQSKNCGAIGKEHASHPEMTKDGEGPAYSRKFARYGWAGVAIVGAGAIAFAAAQWLTQPDHAGDNGFGGLGTGIREFIYLIIGIAGLLLLVTGSVGTIRAARARSLSRLRTGGRRR